MPTQPSWIERIPAILEQLVHRDCPALLNSEAVQRLLGISRRQANRIMSHCDGAYLIGRSVVVPKGSLARRVRRQLDSGALEVETQRRQRLADTLADARQEAYRRRVVISSKASVQERTFNDLPPGIRFEPGLLKISFASPIELLEKLFALSQAVGNDFARFEDLASV